MSSKSTELYLCSCGNLFDDYETYPKGDLPSYGLAQKEVRDSIGRVKRGGNGEVVYAKCHYCRQHLSDYDKILPIRDSIISYLIEYNHITSEDWHRFGMKSKRSFSANMARFIDDGLLVRVGKSRPQKYGLK
jgi:hypothetical protein